MNDDNNVEVLESTSELENLSYENDNNNINDNVNNNYDYTNYANTLEPNNADNFTTTNTNNGKVPRYRSFRIRLFEYITGLAFSLIFIGMSIFGYNYYSKEQATYTEKSSINYQICLKENEYYGESCLSENNEYVSALTNSIRATFNYSKVYDLKVDKKYEYYVNSKIIITTDDEREKELYTKEQKITEKKKDSIKNANVLNITETIDVPFNDFNEHALKYINDYSLISNSKLEIQLVVKEGKTKKEVASLVIPLTQLTYNVTKNEMKEKQTTFTVQSNNPVKYLYVLLIGLFALVFLYILIGLISLFIRMNNKNNKYEKKLKQILNTYDRVIVNINDDNILKNGNEISKVSSFYELLDVRDTIDKPILYYKINSVKSEFYVQDTNLTYKYTMKKSDFDN